MGRHEVGDPGQWVVAGAALHMSHSWTFSSENWSDMLGYEPGWLVF